MSDKRTRLAIAASLLWAVVAAFAIITTHQDVLAQQWTKAAPSAVESPLAPANKSC